MLNSEWRLNMYTTFIFDFDYTLGNSTKGIELSINYALEKLGYSTKSTDAIRKTIGLSLKETFFALTKDDISCGNIASSENLKDNLKDNLKNNLKINLQNNLLKTEIEYLADAEKFPALFKEKADTVMVDNTELYTDTKEVLQNIKSKGCKIAIVTTKFHYRIVQILEKFNACELVDLIVGAEDVRIEKPDPEGLLWAIQHLGADKENVLYIGDSIVDAKTAENAGVDFAGVLTGTTSATEFNKYNNVFIADNLSTLYNNFLNF